MQLPDELDKEREIIPQQAQDNIAKIQQENKRAFIKRRQAETNYEVDELVAAKRTQYGSGFKIEPKFLGPYKDINKTEHGSYEVLKVGDHERPGRTTTIAEYMKKWNHPNKATKWPNVGSHVHRHADLLTYDKI